MKLFRLATTLIVLNLVFQMANAGCNMSLQLVHQPVQCYFNYFNGNDFVTAQDTANVTVSNGQAPYKYSWSDNPVSMVDSTAIYAYGTPSFTVTVTDANSCSATAAGIIVDDPGLGFGFEIINHPCSFTNYGNLQVHGMDGIGSYTYFLSGFGTDTAGTFDSLPVGTYTIIVADSLGCTATTTVVVPTNKLPDDSFSVETKGITCSTLADGSIILSPLPHSNYYVYTYFVDSLEQSDSIFTNLAAGAHVVKVWVTEVDSEITGCPTAVVIIDSSTQVCPAPCSAHFTLYADTTTPHHWFALNQATGTGPLSYVWTWGDNSASDTGATPSHTYVDSGYYNICLTITDSTGCTSTFCDSSTYIRSTQALVITVTVVTALPTSTAIVTTSGLLIPTCVYPNPSTGSWQVTVDQSLVGSALQVFDEEGRLVSKDEIRSTKYELTANTLPSGVYYLRISNDNNSVVKKLVKL